MRITGNRTGVLVRIRYFSNFRVSQNLEDHNINFQTSILPAEYTKIQETSSHKNKWRPQKLLSESIFPKDYPYSVGPGYKKYAVGQAIALCLSTAGCVLSTKALLVAIGIGASSAAPLAGTLNWVIKDGLGQFGGVVFAGLVNNKFDENPKKWRLLSSLSMDTASMIELCTPLFPMYFLPLAAIANIGKNISFLAASASRAALNKSLALHNNLADVTGKCGSQSILASTIGTGMGVGIASMIPGEYYNTGNMEENSQSVDTSHFTSVGTDFHLLDLHSHATLSMICFLTLSGLSLCANYLSLKNVSLTVLTSSKLEYIFNHYLYQYDKYQEEYSSSSSGGSDPIPPVKPHILSPEELAPHDIFNTLYSPYNDEIAQLSSTINPVVTIGADIRQLCSSLDDFQV